MLFFLLGLPPEELGIFIVQNEVLAIVREAGNQRVADILREHYPSHVSALTDAKLRDLCDVKLPRENMQPGNPRWK